MIKLTFILVTYFMVVSCSSVRTETPVTGEKVVQIEHISDKKRRGSEFTENYKRTSKNPQSGSELWRALSTKGVWLKMQQREKKLQELSLESTSELGDLLKGADAKEATLIITVLAEKGFPAIKYLAESLTDKRETVFDEESQLYWYEKKNHPPEKLELRVYAAMQIDKIATVHAYGVRFFLHQIKTDKGPADIIYASKGEYAVKKDDVSKNWIKWWDLNKKHYD